MPGRAHLSLALVVLLAGCVGFAPGDRGTTDATDRPPTTGPAPTETIATTATTAAVPTPTDCGNVWVAFYGVRTDVQDRLWSSDQVSIGYTVPGGGSVFFVAYEDGTNRNGTVLGVEHVEYHGDYAVTADGAPVELDRSLSGERTVSVVAHADADGDGEFDRATDPACLSNGELVTTGLHTFDFDEFGDD